jgi:hypothetical protein
MGEDAIYQGQGASRLNRISFWGSQLGLPNYGAGGRTRTDMSLTSPDFESGAYTNFATPALRGKEMINPEVGKRNCANGRANSRAGARSQRPSWLFRNQGYGSVFRHWRRLRL